MKNILKTMFTLLIASIVLFSCETEENSTIEDQNFTADLSLMTKDPLFVGLAETINKQL